MQSICYFYCKRVSLHENVQGISVLKGCIIHVRSEQNETQICSNFLWVLGMGYVISSPEPKAHR